jgi:hypothetical protein
VHGREEEPEVVLELCVHREWGVLMRDVRYEELGTSTVCHPLGMSVGFRFEDLIKVNIRFDWSTYN